MCVHTKVSVQPVSYCARLFSLSVFWASLHGDAHRCTLLTYHAVFHGTVTWYCDLVIPFALDAHLDLVADEDLVINNKIPSGWLNPIGFTKELG